MSTPLQKGHQQISFEKDYADITKDSKRLNNQELNIQWSTPKDFFKKFSLYPEKSSTTTSANTSMINL